MKKIYTQPVVATMAIALGEIICASGGISGRNSAGSLQEKDLDESIW